MAPLRLGRPEGSQPESGKAIAPSGSGIIADKKNGVSLAAQIWLMLSFQILACLSSIQKHLSKPRLVIRYGDDTGPMRKVRLNRAIKRKLARMQRRGLIGAPRLSAEEAQIDESLSPTQFVEYMIRTKKCSRVRIYHLGWGRKAWRRMAVMWADLQGCGAALAKRLLCRAPLTPD